MLSSEQSDELLAAESRSEPLCLGYARVSTLEQNISQKAATAALGRPRSRASPDVGEGALPQVRAADQISSRLTVEGCVAARFGRRDTDWARRRVACSAWLWLRLTGSDAALAPVLTTVSPSGCRCTGGGI